MIKIKNIQSLTNFKRNTVEAVEQIRTSKSPLVLTVNGSAELVVLGADQYEAMVERLERAETVKAIQTGIEAFENGEFTSAREAFRNLALKHDI